MTATGWLFDTCPLHDRMICWIKQHNGYTVRMEDSWTPSIYAAADGKADLKAILQNAAALQFAKDHNFVRRREKITDLDKTVVPPQRPHVFGGL